MKTIRCGLAGSLLFVSLLKVVSSANGQTPALAPGSIANETLLIIVDELYPVSVFGGSTMFTFSPAGTFYTISPANILTHGPYQYSYTVNSSSSATIAETFPEGVYQTPSLNVVLNFTDQWDGTVVAYDSNPPNEEVYTGSFVLLPGSSTAPLTNMSTRCFIPAGGVAISGLVVAGTLPRQVLIRAVGPTLSQFGVSSPIQHTSMALMNGQTLMQTNTGWTNSSSPSTSVLSQTFATVGAFPLPQGSGDSALLVTLSPGVYTVVTQGAGASDSGTVLVESYFVN